MKSLHLRIETNRLRPKGSEYFLETVDGLSVSQAVERLQSEGLALSTEDIESITAQYTIRHWVGPSCFKQVHVYTA